MSNSEESELDYIQDQIQQNEAMRNMETVPEESTIDSGESVRGNNVRRGKRRSADDAPPRNPVLDWKITDENQALNALIVFINVAQRRGVYTLEESAKIYESIKVFINNAPTDETQ
tara:strand:+ start:118 stop:465 length:348 start_codon:yes stop_codon:yes gene_type:complete